MLYRHMLLWRYLSISLLQRLDIQVGGGWELGAGDDAIHCLLLYLHVLWNVILCLSRNEKKSPFGIHPTAMTL